MTIHNLCGICGEPVDAPWRYHGYAGPCPKPPLNKVQLDPAGQPKIELTILEREALKALNTFAALPEQVLSQIPVELRMQVDVVLSMATVRRVGVA